MEQPDAVLFDVDGVLTVSWQPVDGAPEALEQVRSAGMGVRLLTNTTSRPRHEVGEALRQAGFDVADDEVLTTPLATVAHLQAEHPGARCLLLSDGDLGDDLAGIHLVDEAPDVVVLGGAGPAFSYERVNAAFQAIVEGAPVVAMHRNTTWKTDAGLQLDTGAYLVGLEHSAEVTVTVVGKPAAAMFEAALAALDVPSSRAVMVGDDLESDVHGAQRAGLRGVLVRTGKWRADPRPDQQQPDAIVDSVADVPPLLGR